MLKNVKQLLASALAIVVMGVTGAAWASDIFLNLTNIPGESQDESHKNQIEILSFSLGFVNDLARGRGVGTCGDLVLTKNIDRASPQLLAAVMSGKHIVTGTLSFTVRSENAQDYYVLTMNEILVGGVRQIDSAGVPRVTEQVTMKARTYQFLYRAQQPNGSFVDHKFGWDCARNESF